jgi:putative chitinase
MSDMVSVSALALEVIYPNARKERIKAFQPWLNVAMETFEITTSERQAAFLAQIGHESGELNYVREIASGSQYDVGQKAIDLGNTPEDDGDGERYKGRGLIQITGRYNYATCSRALFNDEQILLHDPEILEEPKFAALSAAWFWWSHGCNELADEGNFKAITKVINGGLNGYGHRQALWETAKQILV